MLSNVECCRKTGLNTGAKPTTEIGVSARCVSLCRLATFLGLCVSGCCSRPARYAPPGNDEISRVNSESPYRRSDFDVTGTFSIVAVDPNAGVCGAAVASKYPAVGKVVPYVRAGVGAFCTQHWHNPDWGEWALDLLSEGKLPEQVLADLLRNDARRDKRQLAIIDMSGRAGNRNPAKADPSGIWWGAASGRYYACQGNTLVSLDVVFEMARAYEQTRGSLADRLIAALVAGDRVGGDHRGRLAAGIRVAKSGVDGCWLELHVDKSDDAVADLARKYARLEHEAKGRPYDDKH